jgi:hypothetical protein
MGDKRGIPLLNSHDHVYVDVKRNDDGGIVFRMTAIVRAPLQFEREPGAVGRRTAQRGQHRRHGTGDLAFSAMSEV